MSRRAINKKTVKKQKEDNEIKAPIIRAKTIKWSAKEEELLLEGIKEFGCHWREISVRKGLSHDGPGCS